MKVEGNDFSLKAKDGQGVYVYVWDNVEEPIGVVQIFHGMAEHAKRYERFAKFLNDKGFIVYANDHRGHGKTAGSVDDLGYIGKDGFSNIVEDEYLITQTIKEKYPNLPVFILGHSFGSFIAQEYIIRYSNNINGVIISGSAQNKGPLISMGKILAYIEMKLRGEKHPSKFLDHMSFGSYNNKIEQPNSTFDWLSRDQAEVKKYDDDAYCGTLFTSNFYYQFTKGMTLLYKKNKLTRIRKELPIYIFSGDMDPVGGYGKLVKNLYEMYKGLGINDVTMKLYPGGRHEMLNETNKQDVYNDIYVWLSQFI